MARCEIACGDGFDDALWAFPLEFEKAVDGREVFGFFDVDAVLCGGEFDQQGVVSSADELDGDEVSCFIAGLHGAIVERHFVG